MTYARNATLLLSVGVCFAAAGAAVLANDDVRLRRYFSVMDLDGSQRVSRSEFQYGMPVVFHGERTKAQ